MKSGFAHIHFQKLQRFDNCRYRNNQSGTISSQILLHSFLATSRTPVEAAEKTRRRQLRCDGGTHEDERQPVFGTKITLRSNSKITRELAKRQFSQCLYTYCRRRGHRCKASNYSFRQEYISSCLRAWASRWHCKHGILPDRHRRIARNFAADCCASSGVAIVIRGCSKTLFSRVCAHLDPRSSLVCFHGFPNCKLRGLEADELEWSSVVDKKFSKGGFEE